MLLQVIAGMALIVATTLLHALCTLAVLTALAEVRIERWLVRGVGHRLVFVSGVVLAMFLASLLESVLWAGVYLAVAAVPDFETALYFSTVTLTTLGYGDVILDEGWRLLAGFQAATGIIIFGWTTAVIVALIQHVHRSFAGRETA